MVLLTALLTYGITALVFFNSNGYLGIGEKIEFSSVDGKFKFICSPAKGKDYMMMLRELETYKRKNNVLHLKIYRTTSRNYLNLKAWCRYKNLQEWNHEYLPIWRR